MSNASTTQRRGPPPLPDAKAGSATNQEITGVYPKGTGNPAPSPRREEREHPLTPELRAELQRIVRGAIDRAIAPLLDKQKKLEQALERTHSELEAERAKLAPRPAPAIPPPLPVAVPAAPIAVVAAARMQAPPLDPSESIPVFVEEEISPAPTVSTGDVPWELDGSRRRRLVAWIFGTLLVLALGAATTAAMLSQAGYRI
jgi:hypothetical protein